MGTKKMLWSLGPFNKIVHKRDQFDCGIEELNIYLQQKITPDLRCNMGRAIVAFDDGNKILGFYTLSMGQITWDSLPEGYNKIPKYPVPVARIGRLAVDVTAQGYGLGRELLQHAHFTVLKATESVAAYAVIVDAKNESAEAFYLKYGYRHLQKNRSICTMFITLKEISSSFYP